MVVRGGGERLGQERGRTGWEENEDAQDILETVRSRFSLVPWFGRPDKEKGRRRERGVFAVSRHWPRLLMVPSVIDLSNQAGSEKRNNRMDGCYEKRDFECTVQVESNVGG